MLPRAPGPSEQTVLTLAHDVLSGLVFLHHKRIVHYDLKPSNVGTTIAKPDAPSLGHLEHKDHPTLSLCFPDLWGRYLSLVNPTDAPCSSYAILVSGRCAKAPCLRAPVSLRRFLLCVSGTTHTTQTFRRIGGVEATTPLYNAPDRAVTVWRMFHGSPPWPRDPCLLLSAPFLVLLPHV